MKPSPLSLVLPKMPLFQKDPSTLTLSVGSDTPLSTILTVTAYFLFNLALALHNKWILSKLQFSFPFLLTTIHILVSGCCSWIVTRLFYDLEGSCAVLKTNDRSIPAASDKRRSKRSRLSSSSSSSSSSTNSSSSSVAPASINSKFALIFKAFRRGLEAFRYSVSGETFRNLAFFSMLYTCNIAMSNVAMNLVSLTFHQINRSTIPLYTTFLEWLLPKLFSGMAPKEHSSLIYLSLVPLTFGVAMATLSESSFDLTLNTNGILLTCFGSLLAALKGIASSKLLSNMHPLELQYKFAPFCLVQCLAYAWWFGELDDAAQFIRSRYIDGLDSGGTSKTKKPSEFSWDTFFPNPLNTPISMAPSTELSSFGEEDQLNNGQFEHHSIDVEDEEDLLQVDDSNVTKITRSSIPRAGIEGVARTAIVETSASSAASKLLNVCFDFIPSTPLGLILVLLSNGLLAFLLNWSSFASVKLTSPLTMTVVNNVKQVVAVLVAMWVYQPDTSPLNICGIVVTLVGFALYRYSQLAIIINCAYR